jgi:hypothetical protein
LLAEELLELAVHFEQVNCSGLRNEELQLIPAHITVDKDHCRPRVSGSTILLKSAGNYEL